MPLPTSGAAIVNGTYLSFEVIQEICRAAISCGLDRQRDALMSGMDPDFRASLQKASDGRAQLLMDLNRLNRRTSVLSDGTVPLKDWLSHAAFLSGHLADGKVFSDALKELEHRPFKKPPPDLDHDPASSNPSTTPPLHPHEAVENLLVGLFGSSDRLRRFLRHSFGAQLTDELPGRDSPLRTVADEAVQQLDRRGWLNEDLFAALAEDFPGRKPDIVKVRDIVIEDER